jgi:gamma-glutamyltranspeptidase / glutathione hydrolase
LRTTQTNPVSIPSRQPWHILAICLTAACLGSPASAESQGTTTTPWRNGAVAADHILASRAGVEILQSSGNVVDAAVATGFALSVLRPGSAGLGGGGFMVIWDAEQGKAVTLDFRERAPGAATRDMFIAPGQDGTAPSSRYGGLAVGVPGQVAGLSYALKHYGTMALADVIAPARRLAEVGVPLDEHEVAGRKRIAAIFREEPALQEKYTVLWRDYLLEGNLAVGTIVRSPQAVALKALAEDGPEAFYTGRIARALAECVAQHGGILSREDLAEMDVVTRQPISADYGETRILSMPPPSSGGVAMVETLNIMAAFEKKGLDTTFQQLGHNTPAYLHLLTESFKYAFADRGTYLGDADFHDVPVNRLTSKAHAERVATQISLKKTNAPEHYGAATAPDDSGTTHYSVIDGQGNAVACTETINTAFGSWVVDPEFGIILNNEMDDFTARPGEPNAFGLIQSKANTVAPRHKPLSSMTPTIVVRDDKAVMALGGSGGPRIITSTVQVLLNLWQFEMTPEEAVSAPRIHHQWLPDVLYMESGVANTPVQDALVDKGHKTVQRDNLASCQVVIASDGVLLGKSDARKHGEAAGY